MLLTDAIHRPTMPYRPAEPEPYRDEDWLLEKYHGEMLSTADIGEICDCTKETIRRWLDRHGIDTRSKSEAAKIRAERYPHTTDAGAEALKEHIKDHSTWWHNATDEEREAFREQLSAERMGEGNPMAGVTGEDHPRWKERTSPRHFYHSERWQEVREKARDRDGHECQTCGATADEYRLHVHHIEPISEGGARFDLKNLITLCPPCHGAKHGDG